MTLRLSPGAVVEGRIVDPAGQPIAGADVFAQSSDDGMPMMGRFGLDGTPAATSDADGSFRIDDRASGERVDLAARHEGFSVARASGVTAPTATPLTLTLQPASAVRGRVLDESGQPVADASVGLRLERGGGGMAFVGIAGNTTSDSDGRFRIEDVEPATLRLTVDADGFQRLERGALEVPGGRDVDVGDLVLHAGATLEGVVSTPDGQPAIGAELQLLQARAAGLAPFARMGALATTDGDGHYRFGDVEPGSQTVQAALEPYDRAVASIDVRAGTNRLDLRLGAGQTVSGSVVGIDGAPVAGASVSLSPHGEWSTGEHEATTDGAGAFRIDSVPDGVYDALAEHDTHADARTAEPITVAGAPVSGIVITMPTGIALTGSLVGLAAADRAQAQVYAWGDPDSTHEGRVDADGKYRVDGLTAGHWTVQARVPASGRRASGTVEIAASDTTATLDLQFGGGVALFGTLTQQGKPLDGAMVFARGQDVDNGSNGRSDVGGRYRLDDLQAGTYVVDVFAPTSGLRHEETVTIDQDHELDVDLHAIPLRGTTVDAGSGDPIAGVSLDLEAAQASPGAVRMGADATSDDSGAWLLQAMGEGSWTLVAQKSGYARTELPVTIGDTAPAAVEVRLAPTQGVTLMVSRAGAPPPERVDVVALRADGTPALGGLYPTDETGSVRLTSLPPGTFELLVNSDGSGTARVTALSPGPAVPVLLAPEATLAIDVPDLATSDALVPLLVIGGDGQRLAIPEYGALETDFHLAHGHQVLHGLGAGSWSVVATAADGRHWSGTATTQAGNATTLELH